MGGVYFDSGIVEQGYNAGPIIINLNNMFMGAVYMIVGMVIIYVVFKVINSTVSWIQTNRMLKKYKPTPYEDFSSDYKEKYTKEEHEEREEYWRKQASKWGS